MKQGGALLVPSELELGLELGPVLGLELELGLALHRHQRPGYLLPRLLKVLIIISSFFLCLLLLLISSW
jgi:hypothetical protein